MPEGALLVFCDTEFTDVLDPELISIALVAEDGREIYLERKDIATDACSDFVHEYVLPSLEGRPEISAGLPEIGNRLAAWVAKLAVPVAIGCDAEFDWMLLNESFVRRDGSSIRPANLLTRVSLTYPSLDFWASEEEERVARKFHEAVDEYHERTRAPRHHALHDARAWRAAWLVLKAQGLADELLPKLSMKEARDA
jgi:hypothetical protein